MAAESTISFVDGAVAQPFGDTARPRARAGFERSEPLDLRIVEDDPPRLHRPDLRQRAVVRLLDIALAGVIAIIASPVAIGTAIAIRVGSGPGLFFAQQRIGRDGKPFRCYKFRTMATNADEKLAELLELDPDLKREFQASYKLRKDPRVTPIGQWLRQTSLDELPQLWNILCGHMSLVGPRPMVPDETQRYGESLEQVLAVKPGLTGRWQVSGRNDISYYKRVEIDVDYARNRNVKEDLRICAKTAKMLLTFRTSGAY